MMTARKALAALAIGGLFLSAGCSDGMEPGSAQSGSLQSTASVVSQDLAQLSVAGVTSEATAGVFSIGWKKFVGPNITDVGTIGEAFAVVHADANGTTTRPAGMDIGTVSLSYTGGQVDLMKRVGKNGEVTYTTFTKGPLEIATPPVNIPFVGGGVYTFQVSGGSGFSAASFQVTAPPSLLAITNHGDRDTVSETNDLTIAWNGGSSSDSVLVRIVPHLRPAQLEAKEEGVGAGGRHGRGGHEFHPEEGGPRPERDGCFMTGGPLKGMGPEFARGVVVLVPNTGSYTLPASDLATLLGGTEAAELMVGVTQVVAQSAVHDGKTLRILLRNGDRIVLLVQ